MDIYIYTLFAVIIAIQLWMNLRRTRRVQPRSLMISSEAPMSNVGSLHVRCGPMFCGKTTWLLREITQCADLTAQHPLLINSDTDTRSKDISSHSSQFKGVSSKVHVVKTKRLSEVDVTNYTTIGIDEAQFYDDLVDTVREWVNNGKHVYCVGLDGDYKMGSFGHIHELVSLADTFEKCRAFCMVCLSKASQPVILNELQRASFSARISESTSQVDVGGVDKYLAVCRGHFHHRNDLLDHRNCHPLNHGSVSTYTKS